MAEALQFISRELKKSNSRMAHGLTDSDALASRIIKTMQRRDLKPMEEADGYRALIDRFGYTQSRVGEQIGKSRSHVANILQLLRLPAGVQDLVRTGQLTAGQARALLGVADASKAAKRIMRERMTVREILSIFQPKRAVVPLKSIPFKLRDGRPPSDVGWGDLDRLVRINEVENRILHSLKTCASEVEDRSASVGSTLGHERLSEIVERARRNGNGAPGS